MNPTVKRPEVLAPAGDLDRLITAVDFGADAVYIGGKSFGMRASPANFTIDDMQAGVTYAHGKGARVYLALNTLPRNNEISQMEGYLRQLREVEIDALIITDLGVLALVKKLLPHIELHISTQMGVVNYAAATALYEMGAKRVVLARELSMEDIAQLRQNTPPDLEIEAFVHGAMCMSFSGRCLLSNYMTGRDANRGECAQPCRWKYYLMEEKRPGQYLPIYEDESGSYILNAKDMCMIEHIPRLAQAGVTSFKIEGRAKSEYYVAVVTNAYRMAVDLYAQDPQGYETPRWLVEEVQKVSHRQYTTGFYFGAPDQYYENGGYVRAVDIVAVVDRCENGRVHCIQRNKFYSGNRIEALPPKAKPISLEVGQLFDEENRPIPHTAHAMMPFYFHSALSLPRGTILRKEKDIQ